jgi:hypothetical protein
VILQPIVFVLRLNSGSATAPRSRFPPAGEALRVFLAGVFLIHVWAIVVVLNEVPAWWLQLDTWDVIGAVSAGEVG